MPGVSKINRRNTWKKEDEAALVKSGEKTNGKDNAIAEKEGAAPADEVATKGRGDDWLIWE